MIGLREFEIPMLDIQQARQILKAAELIHSERIVKKTIQNLTRDITSVLSQQQPLVLCVMGGAVVFTGQLLPQLRFLRLLPDEADPSVQPHNLLSLSDQPLQSSPLSILSASEYL